MNYPVLLVVAAWLLLAGLIAWLFGRWMRGNRKSE